MKNKKLNLNNLSVSSFVTELALQDSKTINGGTGSGLVYYSYLYCIKEEAVLPRRFGSTLCDDFEVDG